MENIEMQLNEMDMLMSMFTVDELFLDDPSALADLRVLVESDLERTSSGTGERSKMMDKQAISTTQIGFTVKLQTINKHTIEMMFRLPLDYPMLRPDISVRSSVFSRLQHQNFNKALHCYINELNSREPVISEIIQWIKENADTYAESSDKDDIETARNLGLLNSTACCDSTFSRLWIYSHHIYNKVKRKTILDLADDLALSGFSVPGKPGIICVEGEQKNADEFWQKVRSMQWKKISLIHREDIPNISTSNNLQQLRKFSKFEEMYFEPRGGKGREVHMDLGLLFQFLQKHGFAEVFQMYFGVSGKETNKDNE